ncbi:SGNH/GDSL hydrolase family protein [Kineosporia mesophila]|uniref:SGNH/GDSL hydrolase family protein n=1 Tax=Kineosporia mesophila TaxID=566012 RepID=A0ABP6ZE38_9ACTN|nr:GDSL-type esterase/lipase family protein [Kineosporia mesophila]
MKRHTRNAWMALASAGAVIAVVVLVSAGHQRGLAAAPSADACPTAAFPGETATVAPTPSPVSSDQMTPALPRTVEPGWSGAWSTAVQDIDGPDLTGRTLRQVVHPTLGGSRFQLRLANTFGHEPVRLSEVTAGLALDNGPSVQGDSVRQVTFGGARDVEIPPGGRVISDPVELSRPFGRSLAIDMVPRGPTVAGTGHARPVATSYLAEGDHAGAGAGDVFTHSVSSWYWLEGIDVPDPAGDGTISMFGDSITEGAGSTPDENRRWPDLLSARMRRHTATAALGVINEGIGGNRVVSENQSCASPSASGLRRFGHDVLERPDVRVVVIALGINDIGSGTPATTVIDGLTQLADRAQEHGLRVVGATLTPFTCATGCLTPEKERQRTLVNDWVRTAPEFDAVVDFDAAVRDPADPERMLPVNDSGDHLHPSDAGMAALAAAFNLDALVGE